MRSGLLALPLVILTVAGATRAAAHVRSARPADDAAFVAACGADGVVDAQRERRVERVRDDVHRAGAARDDSSGSLDDRTREEAIARVAPMRATVETELRQLVSRSEGWVTSSDAPAGARDRLAAAHLVWPDETDLRRGCGDDLLVDDAWVDKSATAVAICPGFLLASASGSSLEDRIAFLLAHEVGHVVAGPPSRGRDPERAVEVFADRWAARLLDDRLANIAPEDRASIVRATLEPICGPSMDPVHPSGRDRIAIVAEMPRVAAALRDRVRSAPPS